MQTRIKENKILGRKPVFGDPKQIERVKIVQRLIDSVPGGFDRFVEVFDPCETLEYFLLNCRDLQQLDRGFENFVRKADLYDEDENAYRRKLLKWNPSSCITVKENNEPTLF